MTDPFANVRAEQLRMNPATWAALQKRGVDEESLLRLDFAYNAPDESSARRLTEFLSAETDYDLDVQSAKTGKLSRRKWTVVGSAQPTAISPSILDQWVGWMAPAGAENGLCVFDGWGAMVP